MKSVLIKRVGIDRNNNKNGIKLAINNNEECIDQEGWNKKQQ